VEGTENASWFLANKEKKFCLENKGKKQIINYDLWLPFSFIYFM
jgi:hypothetical protein